MYLKCSPLYGTHGGVRGRRLVAASYSILAPMPGEKVDVKGILTMLT